MLHNTILYPHQQYEVSGSGEISKKPCWGTAGRSDIWGYSFRTCLTHQVPIPNFAVDVPADIRAHHGAKASARTTPTTRLKCFPLSVAIIISICLSVTWWLSFKTTYDIAFNPATLQVLKTSHTYGQAAIETPNNSYLPSSRRKKNSSMFPTPSPGAPFTNMV